MTKRRRAIGIGIVLGGVWLTACGGGGSGGADVDRGPVDPAPLSAALSQVADCPELHDRIRTDARQKIQTQAAQLRAQGWLYVQSVPDVSPTPAAMPTAAPGGESPTNVTDTNVQVPGVDEADVVETDGNRLYLLHENALVVLDAFPPEAAALAERIPLEGYPFGMFVADGRALVLSTVYDTGELGGSTRCDGIGPPFPLGATHADPGVVGPGMPTCQAPFVKLTLLDLASKPSRIVREIYVEGYSLGARRHGTRARVVALRSWAAPASIPAPSAAVWLPAPPTSEAEFNTRVDRWEDDALAAVDASPLAGWLPVMRERSGGGLVAHPLDCTDVRVPAAGLAEDGGILIVGLDLASNDAPPDDTLLVGRAQQLYANGDTLVLGSAEWNAVPMADADESMVLHVFTLPTDSFDTVYRGSGFVPGALLTQFAIDAQGDVLRVATTVTSNGGLQTATRVVTARVQDGTLDVLGTTPDIAPGEHLFGVRFLGNRAYLVTFRRIDPLFVVDLSDPTAPAVLGEVELPGFSEYLHPLGDHRLLTVGRTGDVFGSIQSLAVRTFDVADPSAPTLTAEYVLPDGWSPVEDSHLAFTFDPSRGLLALPFNRFGEVSNVASLVLVDVDAAGGLAARGTIEHTTAPFAPCAPPYESETCPTYAYMLRGLFIDDDVYSISTAQVQVHALADLTAPLATVELP